MVPAVFVINLKTAPLQEPEKVKVKKKRKKRKKKRGRVRSRNYSQKATERGQQSQTEKWQRRGGHQETNEPRQGSKEDRKSDCKIKKDEREKGAN